MERNRSSSESVISVELVRRKLNSLQPNFGVWRDNLVSFLGPELCAHLHVATGARPGASEIDGIDELRAKVIWQLRRTVIEALGDEVSRRAVAVALNVTKFPELHRIKDIEDRANWCQEHYQWPSRKTIGNRMSLTHKDSILLELAQTLCTPRPTPPPDEIEAILAEFRAETPAAMHESAAHEATSITEGEKESEQPADPHDDDFKAQNAEYIAQSKARWTTATAYNDFDLDTREGVRQMYRRMLEEAAAVVCFGEISVAEVVSIIRSNKARPDLSGHDFDAMTEQVALSAERLQSILDGDLEPEGLYGRVIDEEGNVVAGIVQATGMSEDDDPILISDSEIDAWMRGVLEHSEPADIAAGTLDAIRVLAHHVRVRLERSVAWQRDAEQAAASEPNNVAAQQHLLLTERETKRQLAAADALREAMRQTSPAKVRCFAENVLWHDLSMGAAGNMNVEQLIERFRDDKEFKQYRR